MEENKIRDLVIIGAGPAGLSASVYASRYGIKHVIIGLLPGGLISE
ncbi:MAG TPA: FAD-dependent monooxygenase, partial [Patescibacteria group bacterium]